MASGEPQVAEQLRENTEGEECIEIRHLRGLDTALDAIDSQRYSGEEIFPLLFVAVDELMGAPTWSQKRLGELRELGNLLVIGGRASGCLVPALIKHLIDDVLPYPFASEELADSSSRYS